MSEYSSLKDMKRPEGPKGFEHILKKLEKIQVEDSPRKALDKDTMTFKDAREIMRLCEESGIVVEKEERMNKGYLSMMRTLASIIKALNSRVRAGKHNNTLVRANAEWSTETDRIKEQEQMDMERDTIKEHDESKKKQDEKSMKARDNEYSKEIKSTDKKKEKEKIPS